MSEVVFTKGQAWDDKKSVKRVSSGKFMATYRKLQLFQSKIDNFLNIKSFDGWLSNEYRI